MYVRTYVANSLNYVQDLSIADILCGCWIDCCENSTNSEIWNLYIASLFLTHKVHVIEEDHCDL